MKYVSVIKRLVFGQVLNVYKNLWARIRHKRKQKKLKIVKGKAVPLQAWSGPEGSEEVKIPRFRDNGTGWW
jgi:hypothetical protein